jgi:hypothetical protein
MGDGAAERRKTLSLLLFVDRHNLCDPKNSYDNDHVLKSL